MVIQASITARLPNVTETHTRELKAKNQCDRKLFSKLSFVEIVSAVSFCNVACSKRKSDWKQTLQNLKRTVVIHCTRYYCSDFLAITDCSAVVVIFFCTSVKKVLHHFTRSQTDIKWVQYKWLGLRVSQCRILNHPTCLTS